MVKGKIINKIPGHSRITYLKQYEYTDEMISGWFKLWQYLHIFNKLSDRKTEVIDKVNFELPYGLIGKLFENYVLRKLENIFTYREKATISALKLDSTNLIR